jgi:hypothetical protein
MNIKTGDKMSQASNVAHGLLVLSKYDEYVYADHDIIIAGPDHQNGMTYEDRALVEAFGWVYESYYEKYVFNV